LLGAFLVIFPRRTRRGDEYKLSDDTRLIKTENNRRRRVSVFQERGKKKYQEKIKGRR
jgi:hypothetical protein